MSKIKEFMEHLKADNIIEAFQIVKEELSERSRLVTEEINLSSAEKYNMTRIVESKNDDEEENETEEEKEARRAKEEEEKSSKE